MTTNKPKVTRMGQCKYYRESENETYIPACGVENGVVENDVHPEDAIEWDYCPFCGGKIKLKNHKRHPGVFYDGDDF